MAKEADAALNRYPFKGVATETIGCAFYCSAKKKGERILYAQFSPEDFEFERSATYSEMTSPGMNYPIFQYVRGNSYKVTVELPFHDLPSGKNGHTIELAAKWLMDCLPPETNKKAKKSSKKKGIPAAFVPPTVDFRFGKFKERMVITNVKKKVERMNKEGKMLQGTLTVTMIRVGKNKHF